MKRIAIAAVLALGLAACTVPAHAQISTTNLLTNAGAETGDLSGWTKGGTSNPFVDNGSFDSGINPHTGGFDFAGGNGLSGTLTQSVSLVGNQGITAALIDGGTLQANVGFWEQGLSQGDPSDDGQITLTFLDASSSILGTVSTPVIDSHNGTWQAYNGSFVIPVGARTINYTMDFLRNVGSDNDSFIDDNVLSVSTITSGAAAPEPGSLALILAPFAAMGIARLRRARS